MVRPTTHRGAMHADRAETPVAVPIVGTALLLIDVINDLAFDGSGPLVAQAALMAAPLARLKRRATAAGLPTMVKWKLPDASAGAAQHEVRAARRSLTGLAQLLLLARRP